MWRDSKQQKVLAEPRLLFMSVIYVFAILFSDPKKNGLLLLSLLLVFAKCVFLMTALSKRYSLKGGKKCIQLHLQTIFYKV